MDAMDLLRRYLGEIARVRSTGAGTQETSYYGALQGALNQVGDELKPKVYGLPQMSGTAGFPDFGLFTAPQMGKGGAPAVWPEGPAPERGAVEADDIQAPLSVKRGSQQIRDYLAAYGLVLITNYREFELLEMGATCDPIRVELFSFGKDASAFFPWAAGSRQAQDKPTAIQFLEFLQRVLLRRAPLAEPKDVAFFLASYARDALARVEAKATLPALSSLRDALGKSLGMAFEPGRGEHLFRSTLVQTLFYGLFSAWVTHARQGAGAFDWRSAEWSLHVPMVRALYQQIATPTHLLPLGLVEVLDWAGKALDRVVRSTFFAKFEDTHAVQYFYEPFLEAFDPELRKQLGVWYTPREIVHYMVQRVDQVLRTELDLADGLADPSVWVLDPACGTGSYVVEVLRRIAQTLRDKGEEATVAAELKAVAMRRVAGFEIMPAPFVVAHWQIGSLLRELGAPLDDDTGERAAVYLTNALTGWKAAAPEPHLPFPDLEIERDLAADVKRTEPILVVLGNPPYNAFGGTSPVEEEGLVEPYKEGLTTRWKVRKFMLDDLYVRFFRVAERRIAEVTGRGIVCYITNFSYLAYRSYVVMRERFVTSFDRIWIDCMNGDSRQTGKVTPDGLPDPSVFSTEANLEGIRVGTAIGLMVRRDNEPKTAEVRFRHFWGATKRADLDATLKLNPIAFDATYTTAQPSEENRFTLVPDATLAIYRSWPSVAELSESADWSGILEMRKGALMHQDRSVLASRMEQYCDASRTLADLREHAIGPVFDAGRFNAARAREQVLGAGGLTAGRYAVISLYPFDNRWCFHSNVRPLWNEPRPEVAAQQQMGTTFIVTRLQARKPEEGVPIFATRALPGYHLLDPNSHPFPAVLHQASSQSSQQLAFDGGPPLPNLSPSARRYLSTLGLSAWLEPGHPQGAALWWHVLAIGYAPEWLEEHEDGIGQDWPRVPLPNSDERLIASTTLGRRVADLLDTETPIPHVTAGDIEPALRSIAVLSKKGGGAASGEDLAVTARWGAMNATGAVMPGPGKLEQRGYATAEQACVAAAELLGTRTQDIYLNDETYWRNVPDAAWTFTIGGYQVLKKWLSYRQRSILSRALSVGESHHFRDCARRLAKLCLMGPELDENYRACTQQPFAWRR